MSDAPDSQVAPELRPDPRHFGYNLDAALRSVVSVHSWIPEDALTAQVLGTERAGHGVVIDDPGLILTIGYLITEASTLWISDHSGTTVPGHVVGYDQESGFGLVQALQPLDAPRIAIGRSSTVHEGDTLVVAGHGGLAYAVEARVSTKREFAGYWEYVLDEALFTAPAHPYWGGAAAIDANGALVGIGSLLVQQVDQGGNTSGANMVVPIDLLAPILEELKLYGRRTAPGRPWLGWMVQEIGRHLVVAGVYDGGPADEAGLAVGDVIIEIAGERVSELAELFRRIWALGPAGIEVPVTVVRDNAPRTVFVASVDRGDRLKAAAVH